MEPNLSHDPETGLLSRAKRKIVRVGGFASEQVSKVVEESPRQRQSRFLHEEARIYGLWLFVNRGEALIDVGHDQHPHNLLTLTTASGEAFVEYGMDASKKAHHFMIRSDVPGLDYQPSKDILWVVEPKRLRAIQNAENVQDTTGKSWHQVSEASVVEFRNVLKHIFVPLVDESCLVKLEHIEITERNPESAKLLE